MGLSKSVLTFICFLFVTLISAQPQYQKFVYTIDDGLPSNECHDIVKDSLGYLWIATDRGLSRFDGYGFKNYGISEGLTDISCLDLFMDHRGRIWMSTFQRKIFTYYPDLDSIIEYPYNDVIEKLNLNNRVLRDLYVDKSDNVYVNIFDAGVYKIDDRGSYKCLTEYVEKSKYFVFELDELLVVGRTNKAEEVSMINLNGNDVELVDNPKREYFENAKTFKLNDNEQYLGASGYNYLINNGNILRAIKSESFQYLAQLKDGSFFTGQIFNRGLKWFENQSALIGNRSTLLVPNVSVTQIFIDGENLFVSTIDSGLLFLKKSNVSQVLNSTLYDSRVTAISMKGRNKIYSVIDRLNAVEYSLVNNTTKSIEVTLNEIYSIYYNNFQKELVVGSKPFSVLVRSGEKTAIDFTEKERTSKSKSTGKFIVPVDSANTIIITTTGFSEFSDLAKLPIYSTSSIYKSIRFNSVFKTGDKSYLAATPNGLYRIDNESMVKLDSIHPLFNVRINKIIKNKDKVYLGTQGYGVLVWDMRTDVQVINTNDGLISNNVEVMHSTDDDRIAVGTYGGLSILNYRKDTLLDIENYTIHHGLPANDVYDLASIGDTVLVATGKGLAMISSRVNTKPHSRPIIENVRVNGSTIRENRNSIELNYFENDVDVAFRSLDLSMRGDIEYQVSLNDEDWQSTYNTSVNFSALQPGDYTFRVRSANRDGVWSESSLLKFKITAPWWEAWWFYTMSGVLIIGLGYRYYLSRLKRLKQENEIRNEINDLERSALQAQMNPHFIFNCLNSIQNYIMSNEKEAAMDYLTQFAHLVRQNLNASADTKVSIEEEVSMLSNYLQLEKLRFKNRFDFEIVVDSSINKVRTFIPPLLVQPFVENAIIHGMGAKSEKGLINIIFNKTETHLLVTIKDNGEGKTNNKKGPYKSMGMNITQKRLSYINNNSSDEYKIEPLYNENGTEVKILIKIDPLF